MALLVACLGCILLAVAVSPALGQQDEAIFFLSPDFQCNSTNASQYFEDSIAVNFVEDSAEIFPFRLEESGYNLCIVPSVVNRTVLVFSGYVEGDQVGLENFTSDDLGAGMTKWTIYESNPVTVVQVLQQFSFLNSIRNDAIADNPMRTLTVTVYPDDANSTSSNVTITILLLSRNDPPSISLGSGNDVLTIREDVDTRQPFLIIREPHLLDVSDEESDDLTRIEVALYSPNGNLSDSEYLVLMNDGSFSQSELSETPTSIAYTQTAQFSSLQYFSYKGHKDLLRKVSYYMNADEPNLFNETGSTLLRQISITITDSRGENGTTILNIVIEPVNDHRPVLRFLNAIPGCFRVGPPTDNTPDSAPAAIRSTHNTTLVEQVRTNAWTAYNATGDLLSTYGPAIITPSVLLALLAAVGTVLSVWMCYCRHKRGTKRQRGAAKMGRRAQKYLPEAENGVRLPVVPGKVEKKKDSSIGRPHVAKVSVPRGTRPPGGDAPVKSSLPEEAHKKRKKRREPVTLASLAARKEMTVVSDSGKNDQERSQLAKVASSDDGSFVKKRLQPGEREDAVSTNRSQLALNSASGDTAKPTEGVRSQKRHAMKEEVEVLSPRRVVNATDVTGRSVSQAEKEEEEAEAGRDVFGDLPQRVLTQRRSCGVLKRDATRLQKKDTGDSATSAVTDAVQ